MKIGFIGLGIMGKPMSKNLVKAGNELVVCDFNKDAVAELVEMGAKAASCGAEVAKECDVIITMLPNSPHVRTVALGENGIADGGLIKLDYIVFVEFAVLEFFLYAFEYKSEIRERGIMRFFGLELY